ncbi:TIGR02449 family protein [Marinimicrobium sp. ARAG 43.8]|uniref:TIGR02449 family protein n=1 Tax=Marinimicrobium sp. ARAG 43.8 TaxID=3418719 RepID=UPI003CF59332
MSDEQLEALEAKMDRLIQVCERLQQENEALRAKAGDWQRERVRLIEKNELARGRVEAMITRLKSLESDA